MAYTKFYERLSQIRMTAAALYDRGRALGHGHAELADDLKPLMDVLVKERETAAAEDFAGVVTAIKMLENEAQKIELDARMLTEKARDTRHHAESLKQDLRVALARRGVTEWIEGSFSATIVDGNVTVR